MKLSEAILKGSEKNKQCFDGHFGVSEDGKVTTCAISAAAIACGVLNEDGSIAEGNILIALDQRTGQMIRQVAAPASFDVINQNEYYSPCNCPFAKTELEYGTYIIWHLNDIHHWTREAVALWVETLENEIEKNKAQEQPAQVADGHVDVCRQEEVEAQEAVDMYNDVYGTVKV